MRHRSIYRPETFRFARGPPSSSFGIAFRRPPFQTFRRTIISGTVCMRFVLCLRYFFFFTSFSRTIITFYTGGHAKNVKNAWYLFFRPAVVGLSSTANPTTTRIKLNALLALLGESGNNSTHSRRNGFKFSVRVSSSKKLLFRVTRCKTIRNEKFYFSTICRYNL